MNDFLIDMVIIDPEGVVPVRMMYNTLKGYCLVAGIPCPSRVELNRALRMLGAKYKQVRYKKSHELGPGKSCKCWCGVGIR